MRRLDALELIARDIDRILRPEAVIAGKIDAPA
jgi:hypothetical protein